MSFVATRLASGSHIDYTPGSNVSAGDVVVFGKVCTIAEVAIPANKLGAVAVTGLFRVAKTAQVEFAVGDAVYYNNSTKKATATSSDIYMGVAVAAAGASGATVDILLRSLQEAAQAESLGIEDLSDADLTTPATGDLLAKSAGAWVNAKLNASNLEAKATAGAANGVPFIMHKVLSATSTTPAAVGTAPCKCKLIRWWMISRDTTASTVTILNAGNAMGVKAKGTSNDTQVDGGTVVAAQDEIASGAEITATGDAVADGAVDLFLELLPLT